MNFPQNLLHFGKGLKIYVLFVTILTLVRDVGQYDAKYVNFNDSE